MINLLACSFIPIPGPASSHVLELGVNRRYIMIHHLLAINSTGVFEKERRSACVPKALMASLSFVANRILYDTQQSQIKKGCLLHTAGSTMCNRIEDRSD